MLMKRIFLLALAVLLLWSSGSLAKILSVPQRYQEKDQWCWAGVSQAVLEYYGTSKTQTQIAQYGTNGLNIWNWLWGSSTNPTRNGIDLILMHFAGLPTGKYSSYLSKTTVQYYIDGRKPFVIRWGWDSGGGHFVVGKGISGDYVYLMDPWNGPTVSTYSWVVRGSSHTWTHTLTNETAGPAPDLIVQTPVLNSQSLEPGQTLIISVKVHNQGDGTSKATTFRYYRSTDSTITRSDTFLGTDAVAQLNGGGTSNEKIYLAAPNKYGTYWYGACVDAVTDELSTSNNCSAGVNLGVRPPFTLTPMYHLLLRSAP
ncbi:MAG: hypothetical protein Kow0089_18370 [Desulfobulbaceae bacterium]